MSVSFCCNAIKLTSFCYPGLIMFTLMPDFVLLKTLAYSRKLSSSFLKYFIPFTLPSPHTAVSVIMHDPRVCKSQTHTVLVRAAFSFFMSHALFFLAFASAGYKIDVICIHFSIVEDMKLMREEVASEYCGSFNSCLTL